MATMRTVWCILALSLTTWAAPAEDALPVPVSPAQVTAQLQIQPAAVVKQPPQPIYVPADADLQVQPAVLLANVPLEAEPGASAAVEGGAPAEGDLAASPDANPADGAPGADLETANSFWRGYGGWGGGYGGWGGYRPYYGGGWRHHGYGRGWGGGYGGWGGYRGGYGYWG